MDKKKEILIGDSVYFEYCDKELNVEYEKIDFFLVKKIKINPKNNLGFYDKYGNLKFIANPKKETFIKFAPKRFYIKKQILFEKHLIKFWDYKP